MRSGSTVILVQEIGQATWDVREPGASRPLSSWFDRSQAVRAACDMLRDARGGQLRISTADGAVEVMTIATARRPWWQVTRSPWMALLLAGPWLALSVVSLVTRPAGDRAHPVGWLIDGLIGLGYLTSALLHRRSRRRGSAP